MARGGIAAEFNRKSCFDLKVVRKIYRAYENLNIIPHPGKERPRLMCRALLSGGGNQRKRNMRQNNSPIGCPDDENRRI